MNTKLFLAFCKSKEDINGPTYKINEVSKNDPFGIGFEFKKVQYSATKQEVKQIYKETVDELGVDIYDCHDCTTQLNKYIANIANQNYIIHDIHMQEICTLVNPQLEYKFTATVNSQYTIQKYKISPTKHNFYDDTELTYINKMSHNQDTNLNTKLALKEFVFKCETSNESDIEEIMNFDPNNQYSMNAIGQICEEVEQL